MPIVSTTKMTADQFLVIGEDPPGVRLELVNGEVAVSPRPSLDHSFTLLALSQLLKNHVDEHQSGQLFTDVDTVFGSFDVRCPDLLFIEKRRLKLLKKRAVEVPPDLCVEILSPGSVQIDREDKFDQYAAARVPAYWIIDPVGHTFEAYQLKRERYTPAVRGGGSDRITAPPFEDLEIPLAHLWRPTK